MAGQRRRGAELEAAILAAVRAEVHTHGYAKTTYEGVAAAAETGKGVLYRRWPTKAAMVMDALADDDRITAMKAIDTGSLAGDLRGVLRRGQEVLRPRREIFLGLLADIEPSGSDLIESLFAQRIADVFGSIADHARMRGELGDVPLPPRVLEVPIALIRHEVLTRGQISDDDIDEIVSTCVIPLFQAVSGALGAQKASGRRDRQ